MHGPLDLDVLLVVHVVQQAVSLGALVVILGWLGGHTGSLGSPEVVQDDLGIAKRQPPHNSCPVRIPPGQIPLHCRQMRRYKGHLCTPGPGAVDVVQRPYTYGTFVAHLSGTKADLGVLQVAYPVRVPGEEQYRCVSDIVGRNKCVRATLG